MKGKMKNIERLALGFILLGVLVMVTGCSTAEQPNYKGHKGVAPTVHDYYPSKTK
jgi:hypothetical protein